MTTENHAWSIRPRTPEEQAEIEAMYAKMDAGVAAAKALPFEQTPAYAKAMQQQQDAHMRSGSSI